MILYLSRNYKESLVARKYIKYFPINVVDGVPKFETVLVCDEVNREGKTIKSSKADPEDFFPESVQCAWDLRNEAFNSVRVK